MRPSNNLENKPSTNTYWQVQLVCTKVRVYGSLEPPLQYNGDQMPLTNQVGYDLSNNLESYRNIMHFQISSRRESR